MNQKEAIKNLENSIKWTQENLEKKYKDIEAYSKSHDGKAVYEYIQFNCSYIKSDLEYIEKQEHALMIIKNMEV